MGKEQDLIQAVKDNDVSSVQKMLQKVSKASKAKIIGSNKKFNINFQDGDGMSALHQASLMGSTTVIKLLLEAGSSSDLKDNKGMVALHYAAWQGKPDPVQMLLLRQVPVNEQAQNGETPLHLASQHGHLHVVKLLLTHHADPTICNKELKTPLDLACEFGRCRVVEQLLKSNLCEKLLEDSPIDTLDNSRTTCLHLAAKNGHSDIIRLLMESGMNINRATLNGTCLHEAALCGKTEVVKLLLDYGADVNKPNSYQQTALDIVNKFTTSRAGRELKQLLKEASSGVQARAVKDYCNVSDPQSIAFKEGDFITVLEQRDDGQWKGYVVQEGRMAKTGIFPANHVVLLDGQGLKQQSNGPQAADLINRNAYLNHNGHLHQNGLVPGSDSNSIGSSGSGDSGYPPPPHITNALGPPPSPAYTAYGAPPPSPGGRNAHTAPRSPAPSSFRSGHDPKQSPAHDAFRGTQDPPRSPVPHGTFRGSPNHQGLAHQGSFRGVQDHQSPAHSSFRGVPAAPHSPGPHGHGVPPRSPVIHLTGPPPYCASLAGGVLNDDVVVCGAPPGSPGGPLSASSTAVTFGHHKETIENSLSSHHSTPTHGAHHSQLPGSKPSSSNSAAAATTTTANSRAVPGGVQHAGEWVGPMVVGSGPAARDMKAHSPAKEHSDHHHHQHQQHNHCSSPAHSNRNSAASSDSGRGVSTGHLEPKVVTVIGQHRLSDQSYESGVCSRQSYHSTSSSSLGSLDRLEESGHTSTINVQQLIQAGVPDKEVLHAWLHDLHFEEYYTNFLQAGYDMPTISRMTPEDLTAIGITKPAHRKRLKAEIARLHIHDGIPDFYPHDLIEWLHMLGLGMYHETLAGQGYGDMEYVTDITWEDLEEIGIKKLGHQKKIMLAIDRIKRITSTSKRLSAVEPRRSSIEMLEPPPPAPPIGRWSGEISALPPHMYEGGLGVGAKPKKSPSGDSISTTGSGGSGSNSSQGSGEVRAIPIPREDAGLAGGIPYSRQTSTSSGSSGTYSDMVAVQMKRQGRSSASEDNMKEAGGHPLSYHSFQNPPGTQMAEYSHSHPMSTSDPGTGIQMGPKVHPKPKTIAKIVHAKTKRVSRDFSPDPETEKHESENNSDGNKTAPVITGNVAAVAAMMERTGEVYTGGTMKRGTGTGHAGHLRVEIREHIYDQPQLSPSAANAPPSPKPQVLPKPASPLHVATHHNPNAPSSGSPTARNKKAPPPPPKRTHSIRSDSGNKTEHGNSVPMTSTPPASQSASPVHTSNSNNNKMKNACNNTNIPHNSNITPTTASTSKQENATTGDKPQPQTQAFASCVKSLSERFGSKKGEGEGSRDSMASDGDDFPPPPPPIAMDIITPKIHNYGIPSRGDIHHSPHHGRDYSSHSHHASPVHGSPGFQNRLKTSKTSDGAVAKVDQQALVATAPPVRRISPGRDIPATSTGQDKTKEPEVHHVSSNLGDKRSESTTSFESTTSSSSADSNTLPFANENVGTIKQKAVAIKPSIVQAFDTDDGQRNVELNMAIFESSMHDSSLNVTQVNRTASSGAKAEGLGDTKTSFNSHIMNNHRTESAGSSNSVIGRRTILPDGRRNMAAGIPHSAQGPKMQSAVSRLAATAPASVRLAQQNQQNRDASSEGPPKPPVPSKKPAFVPASPHLQQRPKPQPQQPPQQQQQHQQEGQQGEEYPHQPQQPAQSGQWPQSQALVQKQQAPPTPERKPAAPSVPVEVSKEAPARQSSDVLSDIDDMLQGLTDELDAMLEETVG